MLQKFLYEIILKIYKLALRYFKYFISLYYFKYYF